MGIARSVIQAQLQDQLSRRREQDQAGKLAAGVTALGQPEAFAPLASPAARQGEIAGLLAQGGQVGQQAAAGVTAPLVPQTDLQQEQLLAERERRLLIGDQRGAQQAQTALAEARINAIPMEQAIAASKAQRDAMKFVMGTESELRGEVNTDPAIKKAGSGWQAYQQLGNLVLAGDSVAMQAAITAIAQIQEPGLAVRQDDRLAYSGQNPFIEQMTNAYNRAIGGDVSAETFDRLVNAANALIMPHLQMANNVINDYRSMSARYGADERNIITGLGFDPAQALKQVGGVTSFAEVAE